MKVGEALRSARIVAGLTQRQIAECLGVTTAFISDIENGRRVLGEKYVPLLPDHVRPSVVAAIVAEHQTAIARLCA